MRTLVVDDSLRIRRYLKSLVWQLGEVDEATNGQEALFAIENALDADEPYDLVLLDVGMPDMDGLTALAAIRRTEEAHGLYIGHGARIVMVTAMVDPKTVMGAFKSNCEAYLPKPFTEDEF